jgi:tRNA-2-methylthio-N6-dimethylallyladenosine synthase
MQAIAEENALRANAPLAFVDTYGCQQNESDSEKIRGMLIKMGYAFTTEEARADLIVINTCAVREHAELRVYGNVGALVHTKRAKPDQKIVLCGCMMQQEHVVEKIKKSFPQVDLVFGPHELYRFPELIDRMRKPHKGRIFQARKTDGERVEGLPVYRQNSVKAWLSVIVGCNNFCTYCIVPYVRGRERSRRPDKVLDEARELIALGYRDITLLGQNVNSYGKDLGGDTDFSRLLEDINKLPGDFVLRFMTSHPKDAGMRLFQTMADCEKVENHIHLPVQAGNNRVLQSMNRGYTKESFLMLVDQARSLMPDISLTSDILVGFPGETDEEFEDTLDVVRRVRFDMLFTFLYSPRRGTPAAELPDSHTKEEKQRRFDRLLKLQNEISAQKQAAHVGTIQRVLIDGETAKASERETHRLTGRTSEGRLVLVSGPVSFIGRFIDVKITGNTTWSLTGDPV